MAKIPHYSQPIETLKEAGMCTLLTRAIGAVDDLVDGLNMGDIISTGKTDNDGRLLFWALGSHWRNVNVSTAKDV